MKSHFLSEEWFENETRRSALALGLEQWDVISCDLSDQCILFNAQADGLWFEYALFLPDENGWSLAIKNFEEPDPLDGDLFAQIGTYNNQLDIDSQLPPYEHTTSAQLLDLLIKATYLLGHEAATEELATEFGLHLTAHEKAELRLSLPREFWPKTWLDE